MELTSDQRDDVRNFLLSRGLAFKPLLDEMSDHVSCDLEELMKEGLTYEEAWKQTINQLPDDHFKNIQQETMETINQRFTLSRVFTYVALGGLFLASLFKLLHLRSPGEMAMLSFAALTVSLITGAVSGIYFNRDKEGAMRVLGLVAGTILMMIGYSFKIMHLAGADQLIILAVLITIVSMLVNTFYIYNRTSVNANLFTFLHEKYTPGIERFLLLLIIPILFSRLVHIVLVYAAGLQFIALMWRYMDQDASRRNLVNLVGIVVAFTCLMVPMLGGVVAFELRLTAVILFNIVGAFLSFRFEQKPRWSSYLVCIAPIMLTLTSLVKLGWMTSFSDNLPVNAVICVAIVASVFLSPKYSVMRTFMIMALGYLLEL